MKQSVLDRYEKTTAGSIIIDVAAEQVEELYNNYDKNAPYIRRDLDQDLVDYLIDCAREITPNTFVVRFTLNQPPDSERQSRVCRSVNAYFLYLSEVERQKVIQMFRRVAILSGIGFTLLFLSVSFNQFIGEERSVVANVFAEGLTIAAWVSLWESLAFCLIEWFPHRKIIRLYNRLADAEIIFRSDSIEDLEN